MKNQPRRFWAAATITALIAAVTVHAGSSGEPTRPTAAPGATGDRTPVEIIDAISETRPEHEVLPELGEGISITRDDPVATGDGAPTARAVHTANTPTVGPVDDVTLGAARQVENPTWTAPAGTHRTSPTPTGPAPHGEGPEGADDGADGDGDDNRGGAPHPQPEPQGPTSPAEQLELWWNETVQWIDANAHAANQWHAENNAAANNWVDANATAAEEWLRANLGL